MAGSSELMIGSSSGKRRSGQLNAVRDAHARSSRGGEANPPRRGRWRPAPMPRGSAARLPHAGHAGRRRRDPAGAVEDRPTAWTGSTQLARPRPPSARRRRGRSFTDAPGVPGVAERTSRDPPRRRSAGGAALGGFGDRSPGPGAQVMGQFWRPGRRHLAVGNVGAGGHACAAAVVDLRDVGGPVGTHRPKHAATPPHRRHAGPSTHPSRVVEQPRAHGAPRTCSVTVLRRSAGRTSRGSPGPASTHRSRTVPADRARSAVPPLLQHEHQRSAPQAGQGRHRAEAARRRPPRAPAELGQGGSVRRDGARRPAREAAGPAGAARDRPHPRPAAAARGGRPRWCCRVASVSAGPEDPPGAPRPARAPLS